MANDKPNSIQDYKKWLAKEHSRKITQATKTYYEQATMAAKQRFETSGFWVDFRANLGEIDDEYLTRKACRLLRPRNVEVLIKPFDSFLRKTFRRNVVENADWPDPPCGGWFLPGNWLGRVNDVIRTLFEVKYLDGVQFFAEKIEELARSHSLCSHVDLEAKEEGYYAAHVYVSMPLEIPSVKWDTEKVTFFIEIQITTQLQETIRKLLHRYYEEKRQKTEPPDIKWQWDYQGPEFATSYIGHILHYVEAAIVAIRETQQQETGP